MAEFVRSKVENHYGNVSEFFRDLVRQKIQQEIDADLNFLESTNKDAPPGPMEEDIEKVLSIQRRVRTRRARRI